MSHELSGIITSFKCNGDTPHVVLVGNYHFIPTEIKWQPNYQESIIPPFNKCTPAVRKRIKERSYTGPCAYIETNFFVEGIQRAEVWKNGISVFGPALSFHGYNKEKYDELLKKNNDFLVIDESINTALRLIGIFCREEMDEFDSARLGDYRTNEEMIREYEWTKNKNVL